MLYEGEISDVELTSLSSGDTDNSSIISWLEGNDEIKRKVMESITATSEYNPIDDLTTKVFQENLTDDIYRRCLTLLTFFDAIKQIAGKSSTIRDPQAIFFALLVNLNATKNKSARIKSISALTAAKEISPELDYREYLEKGGEEDSKFNGEYKSIKISRNDFSSELHIDLPVIKGILGTFKFAVNEKPIAKMTFTEDSSAEELNIPATIWMRICSEGLAARKRARFASFERLDNIINIENKDIDEILRLNDMKIITSIPKMYDIEFKDGALYLNNTKEPPELYGNDSEDENATLKWTNVKKGQPKLSYKGGKTFYFVTTSGSTIDVWAKA